MSDNDKEPVEDNRPTSQKDLEARLEADFKPAHLVNPKGFETVAPPYAVEGNDTTGYVGVSPEYMTYADDRQKPFQGEGGVERQVEDDLFTAEPVAVVAAKHEGRQITGVGSTQPLIYPHTSGDVYRTEVREIKADDVPDTVEDAAKLEDKGTKVGTTKAKGKPAPPAAPPAPSTT